MVVSDLVVKYFSEQYNKKCDEYSSMQYALAASKAKGEGGGRGMREMFPFVSSNLNSPS